MWIYGDPEGRTVLLFGKEGDDTAIYAEYIEKPVFGPSSTVPNYLHLECCRITEDTNAHSEQGSLR